MANINFRERKLFSLFSSTFVALLTVISLLRQSYIIDGEVFTALSQWETLIRMETNFVRHLEEFIVDKGDDFPRMIDLKTFLRKVKPWTLEAAKGHERFVSHPVNDLLMIKRFTSDWLEVDEIVKNDDTKSELSKSINLHLPLFPQYEDLVGAVEGIFRLQEIYHLRPQDFAEGNLSSNYPHAKMETEDCFQVGLIAYHDKDYSRAKEWMIEGLRKFQPTIYSSYLTKTVLKEFIAWCEYETGFAYKALSITNEILEKEPDNKNAKENKAFFQLVIEKHEVKQAQTKKRPPYMDIYSSLCRGQTNKTAEELALLTCYYDRSTPKLFIKPAKIEVLNLKPRIVKYSNIITDEEIKVVKTLATPRLRRATINNLATGKLEFAKYRVSKTGWLEDYENEVVDRISKRISSLTGLSTSFESAEAMQVANYGIGGHYEPHWDHAINPKASILRIHKGNRLATFLIYMSDVESGGYTVFMRANAVVKPSKGDAVFWYNLRRSGAGDSSTRHAACPVIVGSKWVSNKWIHSHGQEFRRPCGLQNDGLAWETTVY
ncbi:prolyl 4-hydroxylase subunit alpha-1-like isoform X3 [Dendronephthya gigantea]|uniref:prolyl 4-hydroxylase subunit alpha-1-like isoform X3 n=1 Tax=Dendronephthya gigantea TaxID=151771 RepID=UPI00106D7BCC|nr:prolyl 4-hydroxylase subunit alpha-1-like isoform X3 [Dendronephthya gigantea]